MNSGRSSRALWAVVIPAMTLPFLSAWFYFDLFSDYRFSRWLYGATKVFTLIWPVVAVRLILREAWPSMGLADAKHWRASGLGFLTGAMIVGLMFIVWLTPVGDIIRASADSVRHKTEALGVLDHYWAFGCFIAFLHSFIEEYYWRWFVYGHLSRLLPAKAAAHVLAGLAFSAHHIIITTQYFPVGVGVGLGLMVGIGGMVWSGMYERQRTLAGSWISHVLVDLGILAIGHKLLFGTWI